jgi:hypothetical protein
MEWNSEHFYLPQNGSERNSESILFRGTAGIPSELTICSVYSVFSGIIFLAELPTLVCVYQVLEAREGREGGGEGVSVQYGSLYSVIEFIK